MKYRLQLHHNGKWITVDHFRGINALGEAEASKNESELITGGAYRIQKKGVDGQWATY
tara:strand:- start:4589 stop:4762 length:174 start_codon:yes stop_codon:yes gene_type:complete